MTKNQIPQEIQSRRRQAEQRIEWRRQAFARRNQSAAWLIEEAARQAEITHSFTKPCRIARCSWPLGKTVIQLIDGRASVANLEHCCSPWSCPVCSTVIRAERANTLRQAVVTWLDSYHSLLFLTLTRPHMKSERLDTGIDIVQGTWSDIIASQRWRTIKQEYGIAHWQRATEITWSAAHGWHVHIHALLFIEEAEASDLPSLTRDLSGIWSETITRHGSRAPSKRHGIDLKPVRSTPDKIPDYLFKPPDNIANEIIRMDAKQGRGRSYAPFQLLDQSTHDQIGLTQAKSLWLEYAHATHGQRSTTSSRQLYTHLVDTTELTDEQIINDVCRGMPVLELTASTYRKIKRMPDILATILDKVETGELSLAEAIIKSVSKNVQNVTRPS